MLPICPERLIEVLLCLIQHILAESVSGRDWVEALISFHWDKIIGNCSLFQKGG